MKPAIAAIAFDLDGLMFDTEALFFRVASEMLTARGKRMNAEIMNAMIGRQWVMSGPAFKQLAGLDEPLDELFAESRSRFYDLMDDVVHPTPGLFALLARLRRLKLPRAVATSSRRDYAARLLGKHGLLEEFDFLLTAEDVTRGKPDPEIYRKAAARFAVEPPSLLVLEDSPAGIAAARAAGCYAVGIPHEHSPAEGLRGASLLVDSLDDPALLDLLGAE